MRKYAGYRETLGYHSLGKRFSHHNGISDQPGECRAIQANLWPNRDRLGSLTRSWLIGAGKSFRLNRMSFQFWMLFWKASSFRYGWCPFAPSSIYFQFQYYPCLLDLPKSFQGFPVHFWPPEDILSTAYDALRSAHRFSSHFRASHGTKGINE